MIIKLCGVVIFKVVLRSHITGAKFNIIHVAYYII